MNLETALRRTFQTASPKNAIPLQLDGLRLEHLRPFDLDEEDNLLGSAYIAGAVFHVELISVTKGDGEQEATRDPHGRLADYLDAINPDGGFQTIELQGLPGQWVLIVYPMSR